jgi:predicted adenine nucleotide alpha hydrolase (AANH) superfamily ATPase
MINKIGASLEEKYDIKFLYSDFKKEDGYLKSIKYAKEYDLYRQNYCGCRYSIYDDIDGD